jgi:hypothetical protein
MDFAKSREKMKSALETIPEQMWKRLNKMDLDDLIPPKWTIIVNESGVQVNLTAFANCLS